MLHYYPQYVSSINMGMLML